MPKNPESNGLPSFEEIYDWWRSEFGCHGMRLDPQTIRAEWVLAHNPAIKEANRDTPGLTADERISKILQEFQESVR